MTGIPQPRATRSASRPVTEDRRTVMTARSRRERRSPQDYPPKVTRPDERVTARDGLNMDIGRRRAAVAWCRNTRMESRERLPRRVRRRHAAHGRGFGDEPRMPDGAVTRGHGSRGEAPYDTPQRLPGEQPMLRCGVVFAV